MKRLHAIVAGLAMAMGMAAPPAAAQQTVMVENVVGTPEDFIVTINRYNVRRAGHLADVLADVKYAQPWTKPGVLASNQKWIRYRLDCNTGQVHRAITDKGNSPVSRGDAEGERILLASPTATATPATPLRQAMCKPMPEPVAVAGPWPLHDIFLGNGTDPVKLANPGVQQFPWTTTGAMMESFARARAAHARQLALKADGVLAGSKPAPWLPRSGYLPVAMPFTFHENVNKTVVERGYVDFSSVLQWSPTIFTYNIYASGRTIHSKPGKVQPLQVIGMMVRCGPKQQQVISNLVSGAPAPADTFQTLQLPHAAMQWSPVLGEFSRALCSRQTSFAAKPIAVHEEMVKALITALTPLPIGS